jgi:hypothetical protein
MRSFSLPVVLLSLFCQQSIAQDGSADALADTAAVHAGAAPGRTASHDDLPVIRSTVSPIDILDGSTYKKNSWRLAPEAKPDIYEVELIDGKPHTVTFYTDMDSISFTVELEKSYDFIIQWGEQLCYTRLVGVKYIPAAVFDDKYISSRKGKIIVQIPEVYELVNVGIAITSFGSMNPNFIYQKSEYYQNVLAWFDKHRKHNFVLRLDSLLTSNAGHYASLKMNGYAFYFDQSGNIRRSKVFDRTGFRYQSNNTLLPFWEEMQSFADESRFLEFYVQHSDTYRMQIEFYRDSIDIAAMQVWLEKTFPGSNGYDTYNIIFSPLVSYNQSSTWFESNGFRELQPHVNFPYRRDWERLLPLSQQAEYIDRGNILFTEINHGYINPEAEKYGRRVGDAVSNCHAWVDSTQPANYHAGHAVFNEYMNWGLLSLRILDFVPEEEQEKLIGRIERSMVRGRSFVKFEEFNRHLIDLYKNRANDRTVADLYPQILEWFENNNQ